ncbi:hypothetical protein GWK47_016280 [Chionoecetes opilio]|uniref:Uncharacterized protein n=1 Tax=Chionoecetes opilio TaxID=41210 RepID=A0A8J4XWN3_CHIOP|nr:hypothetical protein GWK47_016280 [Chionoecetes opilio]
MLRCSTANSFSGRGRHTGEDQTGHVWRSPCWMAVWKTLGDYLGASAGQPFKPKQACLWHCELFPDGLTPHKDQTRPPNHALHGKDAGDAHQGALVKPQAMMKVLRQGEGMAARSPTSHYGYHPRWKSGLIFLLHTEKKFFPFILRHESFCPRFFCSATELCRGVAPGAIGDMESLPPDFNTNSKSTATGRSKKAEVLHYPLTKPPNKTQRACEKGKEGQWAFWNPVAFGGGWLRGPGQGRLLGEFGEQ